MNLSVFIPIGGFTPSLLPPPVTVVYLFSNAFYLAPSVFILWFDLVGAGSSLRLL